MNINIYTLLFAIAMSIVFVACPDPDPEVPSDTGDKQYAYIDGQRVKSVGDWFRCAFDDNGDLFCYNFNNHKYQVSMEPLKFVQEDTYSRDVYELKLDQRGLIYSVFEKYSYDDSYDTEKGTSYAKILYNQNRQISKISVSESWIWKDSDKIGTSSNNLIVSYIYSDSVLKHIIYENTENLVINDKEDTETWTADVEFNYEEEYENPYYQYTPNYATKAFAWYYDLLGLSFVGMFGNASSILPSGIEYMECDSKGNKVKYYDTCNYSFMDNGAIENADGYNYSYDTVNTRAEDDEYPSILGSEKSISRHYGIMKHRHIHK